VGVSLKAYPLFVLGVYMKKLLLFLVLFISCNLFGLDTNSFDDDIARGLIDRQNKFWKFGEGTVTTAQTTVWMASSIQPGLYIYPAAAYIMDIVSDDALDVGQIIIVQGLDKNWKMQEEYIALNGVAIVSTQYAYLRINRMAVLDGGSLQGNVRVTETGETAPIYSYISDGGIERNQTQQAFVSLAMGYSALTHSLDMSTYEAKKTNVFMMAKNWLLPDGSEAVDPPFRVQANWNLFNSIYEARADIPIVFPEKTDLELRAFTENATDQITSVLQGLLIQNNSVPIDVSTFVATPGDGEIVLTWDALTPAENSDQKYFEIEYGITGGKTVFDESAVGSTTKTLTGLTNGLEYTIIIKFVGYDMLKSTGVVGTATPAT
jgi:hypothetical protein